MQTRLRILIATAAAGGVIGVGGCDRVWGVHEATLYVPDAGQGGNGGAGGTTSSGGAGGGTACTPDTVQPCYSGPAGTENVGVCTSGLALCKSDGSGFGECIGQVTPQTETCANPDDEDCSGYDCVQWAQLFGGVEFQGASSVALDAMGNMLIAGTFAGAIPLPGKTLTAAGAPDIFVLKLDPTGKVIWGKSFGAPGVAGRVRAVATDATGAATLYGDVSGSMSFGGAPLAGPCIYVAKISDNGDVLWSKGFGSNAGGKALAVTPAGDIVIGGSFQSSDIDFGTGVFHNGTFNPNAFIAELSGIDGAAIWSRAPCSDGTSACEVGNLAIDLNGTLHMAGTFSGSIQPGSAPKLTALGSQDVILAQIALDGTVVRQKQIGGAQSSVSLAALAADAAGNALVAGSLYGTVDLGDGDVSSTNGADFVVQYAPNHSFGWVHLGHGVKPGVAAADQDGNFVIAANPSGSFDFAEVAFTSPGDVFVAKLSGSGALAWSKRYNTGGSVLGLAVSPQGESLLVGTTGNASVDFGTGTLVTAGGNDAFVVKLSP